MRRLARSGRRRRQTPTRPRNDDRPWVHHRGVGAGLSGQTGQDRFRGTRRVPWACCLCGIALVMGFNTGDAALRANGSLTLQKDLFVADGFDPTQPPASLVELPWPRAHVRWTWCARCLPSDPLCLPCPASPGSPSRGTWPAHWCGWRTESVSPASFAGAQCDPVPRGQDPP